MDDMTFFLLLASIYMARATAPNASFWIAVGFFGLALLFFIQGRFA